MKTSPTPPIIPQPVPGHTIALQDAMASDALNKSLVASLVTNVAAGLSGCYVDAGANQIMPGFVASSAAQIQATLQDWPLFKTPPRYIVIDIESPSRPQEWGQQSAAYFAALRLRVEQVKAAFPNSLVGLYGTPFPPPGGNVANSSQNEAAGYKMAVACGVDFCCPEVRSPWVEADIGFGTLPEYCKLGLDAASEMGLPIVPVMAFVSTSGESAGFDKPFSEDVLRWTLAQIYRYSSVQQVVIWAADESQISPAILSETGFDRNDTSERSIRHHWSAICYQRGL